MLWMPWLVALTALSCRPAPEGDDAARAHEREQMVAQQIAARGVRDERTLAAMRKVPRHLFVAPLAEEARARLENLGYSNVEVRAGDGYQGWPEAAPFDAIIVTPAAPRIPEPLRQQLPEGGRLILPVGDEWQELVVVTRRGDRFEQKSVLPVRFVPMTGEVRH